MNIVPMPKAESDGVVNAAVSALLREVESGDVSGVVLVAVKPDGMFDIRFCHDKSDNMVVGSALLCAQHMFASSMCAGHIETREGL